jgi:hypothetical protein
VNLQLNWPTAFVLVALIGSVTLLAMHGDIPQAWIERTLSALLGIVVGIPLGRLRSSGPAVEPAVAAARASRE